MARYFRRRAYRRRSVARARKSYTPRTRRVRRPRTNNVNALTMKAPLASRLLRVKLPWIKTFSTTLSSASSQSYAFQGNGIVPYTALGQVWPNGNTVSAGDTLPAGEIEYSQLYDRYYINGSSIKVEIVNTQASGNSSLIRAVLLAVPFVNENTDSWQHNKQQLDNYTYDQLLAWPFAKWRMVGANTGGASRVILKLYRKTKHMCGLKDLRDNVEYSGRLTDGSTDVSGSASSINPYNGFMYYLRLFTTGDSSENSAEITVRMLLYVTMTNREFNPTVAVTAN